MLRAAGLHLQKTVVTLLAALGRSLVLLLAGRVRFLRADNACTLTMEDGEQFTVFRHVKVKGVGEPAAVFVVRFTPAHMSVRQNIRFSHLPMIALLGMPGFREVLVRQPANGHVPRCLCLADHRRRGGVRTFSRPSVHDQPLRARLGHTPDP